MKIASMLPPIRSISNLAMNNPSKLILIPVSVILCPPDSLLPSANEDYIKETRVKYFFDIQIFCNAFYPFACGGHFIIISLSDGSGFNGADGSV